MNPRHDRKPAQSHQPHSPPLPLVHMGLENRVTKRHIYPFNIYLLKGTEEEERTNAPRLYSPGVPKFVLRQAFIKELPSVIIAMIEK